MRYYNIDFDIITNTAIPIISTILTIISIFILLYYKRKKLKIKIFITTDQTLNKNYQWTVKLTISNSGFTPFSIVKITDKNKNEIYFINNKQNFPVKFDPGDIKDFYFRYNYSTKNNYIFVYDHRGKCHKAKVKKNPPLIIPDNFKEILTNSNYRTIGHLKVFILSKFKKY